MAAIRIPCLVPRTNKAGITSWYWQPSATLARAGWQPIALGKDRAAAMQAAEARNAEVERWRGGGIMPHKIAAPTNAGTVSALIARYRREVLKGKRPDGKPRLKARTVVGYETNLARIEAWAGKHPVAYVTPARVRALRDATVKPAEQGGIGHSAAFALLKQLRQLFAFSESIDLIPKGSNPATGFDLGGVPPRKRVWEVDDEAAFKAAAFDLGLPSLALALEIAIYTAQREGDLIAFTEAQLAPIEIFDATHRAAFADAKGNVRGWIVTQGKTGTPLELPMEPALLKKIDATLAQNRARDRAKEPRRLISHVLVDDRTGLPWKNRAFIAAWRKVLNHAAKETGRPDMTTLVWHDLRRTRVVRLRRRGMPKEMIATITGHSPQSLDMMLKVYGPIDRNMTFGALAASL